MAYILKSTIPIYLIGESHCIGYNNIIFESWNRDIAFICHSRFRNVAASQYIVSDGNLHPQVFSAFKDENLINEDGKSSHLTTDNLKISVDYLSGRPVVSPPIVLFAGDIDLAFLIKNIGDKYDFDLPNYTFLSVDETKKLVPFAQILSEIERLYAPFFLFVKKLQESGFNRLAVHSIPPRTKDDDAFFKWIGVQTTHTIRAKLTILANNILRRKCNEMSLGFIDVYNDLTKDGFLRKEYELDGMHVNEKAILISLERIADHIYDNTNGNHNLLQYQILAQRAADFTSEKSLHNWLDNGWLTGVFDYSLIEKIQSLLIYDKPSINTFAHPDWVGSSRHNREGIIFAEPNSQVLEVFLNILQTPIAQNMIHAGLNKSLTVISCRPIKITKTVFGSNLIAPKNSRRAIVVLEGAGMISLKHIESQNNQDINVSIGSLIVFDPTRWICQYTPELDSLYLAELCLIPRLPNHPFRMLWIGGNDWPADPFCYSLTGSISFPPFLSEKVHERILPL
jgi:hypothetical protein